MGRDDGVHVAHDAVKNAKTDLEEMLALLSPDPKDHKATRVFADNGAVRQLLSNSEAVGGFWPAAQGFQGSVRNAGLAVTGSYTEITKQLENAIGLLKVAITNFETRETAGAEHAGQIQV